MRVLHRAGALAGALLLGGCPGMPPAPPPVYPSLRDTLGPSWTLVPLPSGALLPGAIVRIQNEPAAAAQGSVVLQWIAPLSKCGVPDSALVVSAPALAAISAGATFGADASVAAQLANVSGELGGNASSTANLTINSSTDSSLDYVSFQRWATDPANAQALSQACGSILAQPGMAVVQEAFVISSGSYTFQTNKGAKIKLSPPAKLPVQAGVSVTSGTQGTVTISQPLVFALRLLQPLPQGGFALEPLVASNARRASRHAVRVPPPPPLSPAIQLGGTTVTNIEGLPSR